MGFWLLVWAIEGEPSRVAGQPWSLSEDGAKKLCFTSRAMEKCAQIQDKSDLSINMTTVLLILVLGTKRNRLFCVEGAKRQPFYDSYDLQNG